MRRCLARLLRLARGSGGSTSIPVRVKNVETCGPRARNATSDGACPSLASKVRGMDTGRDWLVVGASRGTAGLTSAIGRLDAISSDAPPARRERQKKYSV